jgi:EmrB/QacA subfamily drug resistance transporter
MNVHSASRGRPGLRLAIFSTAAFMGALDTFIVNVSLRSIGPALGHPSLSALSWVLNAYTIIFAALLIPAGSVSDRLGNRRCFVVGLMVFSLASLGCALAPALWLLIALRSVQALGAAILSPASLGLILTTLPAESRTPSIRVWTIAGSLGAVAGPVLGGLLTAISWRWIFIVNVPIGLACAISALRAVPELRHDSRAKIPDLASAALVAAAIGLLALALVQAESWGWGSPGTLGCLAGALVTGAGVVLRTARTDAPLVDPGLLRDLRFGLASVEMLLVSVTFGLQLVGVGLWMQQVRGWSTVQTGWAIAPSPAVIAATLYALRRWGSRLRPELTASLGMILVGGGGIMLAVLTSSSTSYLAGVLPGWLLIGAGVGLSIPTIIASGSATLPAGQASTGSALIQTSRWVGSAIGVALLVILLGPAGISAHRFSVALWWTALPSLAGAALALTHVPAARARAASEKPRTGAANRA